MPHSRTTSCSKSREGFEKSRAAAVKLQGDFSKFAKLGHYAPEKKHHEYGHYDLHRDSLSLSRSMVSQSPGEQTLFSRSYAVLDGVMRRWITGVMAGVEPIRA